MPLRIEIRRGRACPILVCDWCERPIEKAGEGLYHWPGHEEGYAYSVTLLHNPCSRAYEAAHPEIDLFYWMPLHSLLFHLTHNLKPDLKLARSLAEIG